MAQHGSPQAPRSRTGAHSAAHSASRHRPAARPGGKRPSADGPRKGGPTVRGTRAHHAAHPARPRATGLVFGVPALVLAVLVLVLLFASGTPRVVGLLLGVLALAIGAIGLTQTAGALASPRADGMRFAGAVTCAAGAVAALAATVLAIVLLASGGTVLGTGSKAALACGDTAIEAAINPTSEQQAAAASEIADTLEDSGLSMDEMGLTTEDFSSWMFDGASYERITMEVASDATSATLVYEVKANKVDTLLETVSDEVNDMDYDGIVTMTQAYEKIGEIMLYQMKLSRATVKTIELELELTDSGWEAQSDTEALIYEIFYE